MQIYQNLNSLKKILLESPLKNWCISGCDNSLPFSNNTRFTPSTTLFLIVISAVIYESRKSLIDFTSLPTAIVRFASLKDSIISLSHKENKVDFFLLFQMHVWSNESYK